MQPRDVEQLARRAVGLRRIERDAAVEADDVRDFAREIVHPQAQLAFDSSKPDGAPRKLLDVSRLHALGWRHRIALKDGIASSYGWFLENHATARGAEKGAAA